MPISTRNFPEVNNLQSENLFETIKKSLAVLLSVTIGRDNLLLYSKHLQLITHSKADC